MLERVRRAAAHPRIGVARGPEERVDGLGQLERAECLRGLGPDVRIAALVDLAERAVGLLARRLGPAFVEDGAARGQDGAGQSEGGKRRSHGVSARSQGLCDGEPPRTGAPGAAGGAARRTSSARTR